MDFLVCKRGCVGVRQSSLSDSVITGVKDIIEAISRARNIAEGTRKGVTVALFTSDAKLIYGWKVMGEGKLKYEDLDVIQDIFYDVSTEDFKLAKRQYEIRRNLHLTTIN